MGLSAVERLTAWSLIATGTHHRGRKDSDYNRSVMGWRFDGIGIVAFALLHVTRVRAFRLDRRRVILRTTPEAEAKLARLAEVQSQVNDEHFSPLTHGDFQTFKRLIAELVDSTDRALALLTAFGPRIQEQESKKIVSAAPTKRSQSRKKQT